MDKNVDQFYDKFDLIKYFNKKFELNSFFILKG